MNCLGICSSFSLVYSQYRFFCAKLQSIALLLVSAQSIDQLGGLLWPGWQRCWLLSTSNSPVLIQPPHPTVPCCPFVWPQSSIWRSSPGWGWLYWQILFHTPALSLSLWFIGSQFPPVDIVFIDTSSQSLSFTLTVWVSAPTVVSLEQSGCRLYKGSLYLHPWVISKSCVAGGSALDFRDLGELFNSKFTPVLCWYLVLGVVLNMIVQYGNIGMNIEKKIRRRKKVTVT